MTTAPAPAPPSKVNVGAASYPCPKLSRARVPTLPVNSSRVTVKLAGCVLSPVTVTVGIFL